MSKGALRQRTKITVPNELRKDIQKLGNEVAKNISRKASELITEEYQYIITQFYSSYTPSYYHRSDTLRDYSYKPYFRSLNNHYNKYIGGVEFTPERMDYVGYTAPPEEILSYALQGYHGHPSLDIHTGLMPYEHMLRFRDSVLTHIDTWADWAIVTAKHSKPFKTFY